MTKTPWTLGTTAEPSAEVPIEDGAAAMLFILAGMGCNMGVIEALVEMGGPKLSADQRHFMNGPLVVHASPWMADIPKWMFDQARAERVEIVHAESKGGETGIHVGPSEIAAVMMPATMESLLNHKCSQLYIWASARAVAKHRNETVESINATIYGGSRDIPTDADILERGGRYWHVYWPLASEIRRKVTRAGQARVKADRKQESENRPPVDPPAVIETQLSFFDQQAAE